MSAPIQVNAQPEELASSAALIKSQSVALDEQPPSSPSLNSMPGSPSAGTSPNPAGSSRGSYIGRRSGILIAGAPAAAAAAAAVAQQDGVDDDDEVSTNVAIDASFGASFSRGQTASSGRGSVSQTGSAGGGSRGSGTALFPVSGPSPASGSGHGGVVVGAGAGAGPSAPAVVTTPSGSASGLVNARSSLTQSSALSAPRSALLPTLLPPVAAGGGASNGGVGEALSLITERDECKGGASEVAHISFASALYTSFEEVRQQASPCALPRPLPLCRPPPRARRAGGGGGGGGGRRAPARPPPGGGGGGGRGSGGSAPPPPRPAA